MELAVFEIVVDEDSRAIQQCFLHYRKYYKNLSFLQKKEMQYSLLFLIQQYEHFGIKFVYTEGDQKIKLIFKSDKDYSKFLIKWSS